jgi:hypothetical protein
MNLQNDDYRQMDDGLPPARRHRQGLKRKSFCPVKCLKLNIVRGQKIEAKSRIKSSIKKMWMTAPGSLQAIKLFNSFL